MANKNLYQEVIDIITKLNEFIIVMDEKIQKSETNYENRKRQIVLEHQRSLNKFDSDCKIQIQELERNKNSLFKEAQDIKNKIEKIDEDLSRVDKYYIKTKKAKLEELKQKKSDSYSDSSDYFKTLKSIQNKFLAISIKYSTDILPSLINHLNYIFSSKRKKDYEELIILHNTVDEFINNLKLELDEITDERKEELLAIQKKQREEVLEKQNEFKEKEEKSYVSLMNDLTVSITNKLDEIIPDEVIDNLANLMEDYKSCYNKVNKDEVILNDVLYMGYVLFPLKDFVFSSKLSSLIIKKCSKLIVDSVIRFPIIISKNTLSAVMIKKDKNSLFHEKLAQGIMYCFLTTVPASKLRFSVIDCENHGNSIEAYFDAKKRIPNLFDEKIYTTSNLANEKIKSLNDKIEYITQNILGTKYNNIYDYIKDHKDYNLEVEVLTIFDLETSIDSSYMSYLKNIILQGGKCGIYLIITSNKDSENTNYSNSYIETIKSIEKECITITQDKDDFVYLGLSYQSPLMPSKLEFNNYISKYSLIVAGITNKGIALPNFINGLLNVNNHDELLEEISNVKDILDKTDDSIISNLKEDMSFPLDFVIGKVLYPKDIFSESSGYEEICNSFSFEDKIMLPFLFDLTKNSNFAVVYDDSKEKMAKDFIINLIWQFLANIPVTKSNICIMDPDKKGGSVLPLLDFRKENPDIFDDNIYTSGTDITRRLEKFNQYIDDMIQNKLSNKYDSLVDYNLKTPNKMEIITLLVIYDFPNGFDDNSLRMLENILKNGSKCGIYTVIGKVENASVNEYANKLLVNYLTRFVCKDDSYLMLPFNLNVTLNQKLDYSNILEFVKKYQELYNIIKGKGISFEDILEKELFSRESSKILEIPVGVGDEEKIVPITFGYGSSHHALVAGATGSGKSTLLHTLIMSAMLHYSPDKLNLYLMDFKGGTEFKIYDSYRLPHIKLLALDAMQEFGESILENLVSEIGVRSQKFKEANVSNLKKYIEVTNNVMPKILVIMDEFQILFNDNTNRKVANNCAELVKRIVTEGRSYGIHLLMATQSTKIISNLTIETGTIEQMRIRVGLKCAEYDTNYLFGDKNFQKINEMMKGPIGTAVLNEEYTEESPIGMRVVYCDVDTQKKYLQIIEDTFKDYEYDMQSFEGNKVTKLLDVLKPKWQLGAPQVLVGNLIKVAPDLCISFDKRRRHNTLICGSNERMVQNVLNTYILNLLLNKNTLVYAIDGDIILGEEDSNYQKYSRFDRFKLALDNSDIIKFINEMYDIYLDNKKNGGKTQVALVIDKIQYLDLVIKLLAGEKINEEEFLGESNSVKEEVEDDPFDFSNLIAQVSESNSKSDLSINDKLNKLVDDGFSYGFSCIITSSELQTVKESLYYGINHLAKFPDRYVFSLSNDDASYLVDGVSSSSLPDNVIYYTDSIRTTCQVKPFKFPEADELDAFISEVLRSEE